MAKPAITDAAKAAMVEDAVGEKPHAAQYIEGLQSEIARLRDELHAANQRFVGALQHRSSIEGLAMRYASKPAEGDVYIDIALKTGTLVEMPEGAWMTRFYFKAAPLIARAKREGVIR